MKMSLCCLECDPNGMKDYSGALEFDDLAQNYRFTCSKGHVNGVMLLHAQYEILFEIGVYAIEDGYYREAVSSFAAALERFYEYAIRVACRHAGVPYQQFDLCWNQIKQQSERQLGAFMFLFLATFKRIPEVLPNGLVRERNEVVHKGRIPSRSLALKFGNEVGKIITTNIKTMRMEGQAAVDAIWAEETVSQFRGDAKELTGAVMRFLLSRNQDEFRPLEDVLASTERFTNR